LDGGIVRSEYTEYTARMTRLHKLHPLLLLVASVPAMAAAAMAPADPVQPPMREVVPQPAQPQPAQPAPALPPHAVQLAGVQLQGVDGELAANVRARLSLQQLSPAQRQQLSETRLGFLLRAAVSEVQQALEPYGYYDAEVTPELRRSGDQVTVLVQVRLGEPVRVRELDLAVEGPAREDAVVAALLARFHPQPGELLHHAEYEASKAAIARALDQRGYFDAELGVHRIAVTRASHSAAIGLSWTSGRRYRLGAVRFEGGPLRPGVLAPLVPWRDGDPYDQAQLLALQQSLVDADYFSAISLLPEPDKAVDGRVPIKVSLAPGKRSVYNLGLRYGTDSGAGINARLERRWVNMRGHKMLAELNLAQFKSDLTVQYKVPAFGWLDGWYTYSASLREEQIEDITSQYIDVAATRSGRWRGWNLLAGLNFKRERFDSFDGARFGYATVVYPSLWGQWKHGDDANVPRHGRRLTLELRGGVRALGSDLDFLQVRAEGRYIRPLGTGNRLLLRGELGSTLATHFDALPPSMRFYAGGDQSLRGYGYKEIGQRVDGHVVGGKHLAVASAEFEHMFTPVWGAAVFVDAGDAFDDRFDARIGVGAGLRWRSPVGPVRVDIGHGIGDPDQPVRLHISIGPDL
jgi:translocation and assembly module TamA